MCVCECFFLFLIGPRGLPILTEREIDSPFFRLLPLVMVVYQNKYKLNNGSEIGTSYWISFIFVKYVYMHDHGQSWGVGSITMN